MLKNNCLKSKSSIAFLAKKSSFWQSFRFSIAFVAEIIDFINNYIDKKSIVQKDNNTPINNNAIINKLTACCSNFPPVTNQL